MATAFTFLGLSLVFFNIERIEAGSWFGAHFECTGRNRCYDDQIHCYDDQDCIVHCNGDNACQYSVIHCPANGHCTVTCSGGLDACKDVVFLAKHSSSLSIACDAAEEEACDEMVVYCPDNGVGGPVTCQIGGVSAYNVQSKMEIFAVEGLDDVYISGSGASNLHLYCNSDYSSPCTLPETYPFAWCTNDDLTCEAYVATTTDAATTTSDPDTSSVQTTSDDVSITNTLNTSISNVADISTTQSSDSTTELSTTLIYTTPTPTINFRIPKPTDADLTSTASSTSNIDDVTSPNILQTTSSTAYAVSNAAQFVVNETQANTLNPLYYVITALMTSIVCVSCLMVCWVRHHQSQYKQQLHVIDLEEDAECAMSPSIPMMGPNMVPEVRALTLEIDGHRSGQTGQNVQTGHPSKTHLSRHGSPSALTGLTAPTSHNGDTEFDIYAPTTMSGDTKMQSSASSSACASSTEASSTLSCSASDDKLSRVEEEVEEEERDEIDSDCLAWKEVNYETGGHLLEQEADHDMHVVVDSEANEESSEEEMLEHMEGPRGNGNGHRVVHTWQSPPITLSPKGGQAYAPLQCNQDSSSDEESNLASSVDYEKDRKQQRTHTRLAAWRMSDPEVMEHIRLESNVSVSSQRSARSSSKQSRSKSNRSRRTLNNRVPQQWPMPNIAK